MPSDIRNKFTSTFRSEKRNKGTGSQSRPDSSLVKEAKQGIAAQQSKNATGVHSGLFDKLEDFSATNGTKRFPTSQDLSNHLNSIKGGQYHYPTGDLLAAYSYLSGQDLAGSPEARQSLHDALAAQPPQAGYVGGALIDFGIKKCANQTHGRQLIIISEALAARWSSAADNGRGDWLLKPEADRVDRGPAAEKSFQQAQKERSPFRQMLTGIKETVKSAAKGSGALARSASRPSKTQAKQATYQTALPLVRAAEATAEGTKKAGRATYKAGADAGQAVMDAGKVAGSGIQMAGKTVGKGVADTGKAIGKGAVVSGEAVAKGAVVTAQAVAGAVVLAGQGTVAASKAVGKGGKKAGLAVADATTTGGKAIVRGATQASKMVANTTVASGKAVARGATQTAETARKAAVATKNTTVNAATSTGRAINRGADQIAKGAIQATPVARSRLQQAERENLALQQQNNQLTRAAQPTRKPVPRDEASVKVRKSEAAGWAAETESALGAVKRDDA